MNRLFLLSLIVIFSVSCKEEKNEDIVQQPDKNKAIETVLSVSHHEGFDLLHTTHKIWVKGKLVKTITTADTLPDLGMETVTVKDNNGVTKTEQVRQDYEFYITVQ